MATSISKKKLEINYQLEFQVKNRILFDSKISLQKTFSRLVVVGDVGSGKSCFLKTIAGILRPNFCQLVFNGVELTNTQKNFFVPLYRRGIVYLWQDSVLFPHLSVERNLLFSPNAKKILTKEKLIYQAKADHLLEKIPCELSGGEKQKVCLLQALMSKPQLLLLDESFSNLDKKTKILLFDLLLEYQKEYQTAIIYVSHQQDASDFAEQLVILEKGRIR